MGDEIQTSVIIPTHNRSASLRRMLDAIGRQEYPPEQVEVIVVADGCSDDTAEAVHARRDSFALSFVEQQNQGPAAARNRGAAQARGRWLIFLDDDIEPMPGLIRAHVQALADQSGRVTIGYLPAALQGSEGFFAIELRGWWEAMFRRMREPGHRYGYWDLLSGNLALEARLFHQVDGFDTTLRCHEDYEIGFRLIQSGASLVFVPEAMGYHHEQTDLRRSLQRKYEEGRADVIIVRRHPELCASMPLSHLRESWSRRSRLLRRAAFAHPRLGDGLAVGLQRLLDGMEWIRSRGRWRRLLDDLLDYWYWRGVAEQVGTQRPLVALLQAGSTGVEAEGVEIELDLKDGLERAERRLDQERPTGVQLCYGRQLIGRIPSQPGAERLRGIHLRPAVATTLSWQLLTVMALDQATCGLMAQADGPGKA